jgi:hypothetical protein
MDPCTLFEDLTLQERFSELEMVTRRSKWLQPEPDAIGLRKRSPITATWNPCEKQQYADIVL